MRDGDDALPLDGPGAEDRANVTSQRRFAAATRASERAWYPGVEGSARGGAVLERCCARREHRTPARRSRRVRLAGPRCRGRPMTGVPSRARTVPVSRTHVAGRQGATDSSRRTRRMPPRPTGRHRSPPRGQRSASTRRHPTRRSDRPTPHRGRNPERPGTAQRLRGAIRSGSGTPRVRSPRPGTPRKPFFPNMPRTLPTWIRDLFASRRPSRVRVLFGATSPRAHRHRALAQRRHLKTPTDAPP
ncbi:hypothetical protein Pla163_29840 [Planctomycetes bacterium Pla163]|uniref:Uncharacterized protein n=1 Tax=Rohdeia mirabilis TaxID=2528008 RepID=A0A518D2Y4_9BACT|nr:hypothetical protein Pla163_29840 [Planctomycetes bacterium Pla163]